jgi:hypothetical protein
MYRRKPQEVMAMQITEDNIAEAAEWCGGEVGQLWTRPCVLVHRSHVSLSNYLVRDNGSFYSCPEKLFKQNYVPVEAE